MQPEAWGFAGLLVTNIFALVGLFIQNRRQSSGVQDLHGGVQDLHAKVAPVSNGFASHVTGALARIEVRLDDHMRGHP